MKLFEEDEKDDEDEEGTKGARYVLRKPWGDTPLSCNAATLNIS